MPSPFRSTTLASKTNSTLGAFEALKPVMRLLGPQSLHLGVELRRGKWQTSLAAVGKTSILGRMVLEDEIRSVAGGSGKVG